jgi:hypothetical protein
LDGQHLGKVFFEEVNVWKKSPLLFFFSENIWQKYGSPDQPSSVHGLVIKGCNGNPNDTDEYRDR